jgi:uncharacterized protein DUF4255/IPT/TIG domain-containing protein
MSDYLAVGGVTAVLRWLLAHALTSGGPSTVLTSATAITAISPDLITVGNSEEPQLNLFMYNVSLNPALRNLGLPSRDAGGNQVASPPLALDLHYLISAYGSTPLTQLAAEIQLGWAMKVFHDTPVVSPDTIQTALSDLLTPSPSAEAKLVAASSLAGQIEHIKITPQALTTEEIYRLWPAFQAPYRPSTAIQVSVVVIRDTAVVTSAPPVRHRRLVALPLQSPVISGISPVLADAGQLLTITGANFLGQLTTDTTLSFDGLAAAVPPDLLQGGLLKVTLPAALQAGTRMVRVQRMVTFPDESTPRQGFSSSPAPFQLIPAIQNASPIPATLGNPLSLTISPPVGRAQQVTVYIRDDGIGVPARLPGAPATAATVTVTVPPELGTGTFPIRVEVDGASSTLTQVASGEWTPQVAVA